MHEPESDFEIVQTLHDDTLKQRDQTETYSGGTTEEEIPFKH